MSYSCFKTIKADMKLKGTQKNSIGVSDSKIPTDAAIPL